MTDRTSADVLRAQTKAALKAAGISQAEAARQLSLSTKHMSHMLTGRATLTLDWADRIHALCGARIVIASTQPTAPGPRIPLGALTSDALDQLYDRLDAYERWATAAEARVTEYEHTLNWHTTCTSCARILDAAYTETMRAEQAEAARDRYRTAWKSARARAKKNSLAATRARAIPLEPEADDEPTTSFDYGYNQALRACWAALDAAPDPDPGTVTITRTRHDHLVAGQCIHHQETHRLHHGEPVAGCPYPGCWPDA